MISRGETRERLRATLTDHRIRAAKLFSKLRGIGSRVHSVDWLLLLRVRRTTTQQQDTDQKSTSHITPPLLVSSVTAPYSNPAPSPESPPRLDTSSAVQGETP